MTQADFKAFSELMQGVAECYGQSLSDQGVALRFIMLEALPVLRCAVSAQNLWQKAKPSPPGFTA